MKLETEHESQDSLEKISTNENSDSPTSTNEIIVNAVLHLNSGLNPKGFDRKPKSYGSLSDDTHNNGVGSLPGIMADEGYIMPGNSQLHSSNFPDPPTTLKRVRDMDESVHLSADHADADGEQKRPNKRQTRNNRETNLEASTDETMADNARDLISDEEVVIDEGNLFNTSSSSVLEIGLIVGDPALGGSLEKSYGKGGIEGEFVTSAEEEHSVKHQDSAEDDILFHRQVADGSANSATGVEDLPPLLEVAGKMAMVGLSRLTQEEVATPTVSEFFDPASKLAIPIPVPAVFSESAHGNEGKTGTCVQECGATEPAHEVLSPIREEAETGPKRSYEEEVTRPVETSPKSLDPTQKATLDSTAIVKFVHSREEEVASPASVPSQGFATAVPASKPPNVTTNEFEIGAKDSIQEEGTIITTSGSLVAAQNNENDSPTIVDESGPSDDELEEGEIFDE